MVFGRNALGREGKAHDHKESVEDLNRTNDEAAIASEQAPVSYTHLTLPTSFLV